MFMPNKLSVAARMTLVVIISLVYYIGVRSGMLEPIDTVKHSRADQGANSGSTNSENELTAPFPLLRRNRPCPLVKAL